LLEKNLTENVFPLTSTLTVTVTLDLTLNLALTLKHNNVFDLTKFFGQVHKIPITGKLFVISEIGKLSGVLIQDMLLSYWDQEGSREGLKYSPNNLFCPQKQCYVTSEFLIHFN